MQWSCYDLFAGVQCGRKALEFIQAAAAEKWGVVSKISFGFMAPRPFEKDPLFLACPWPTIKSKT